MTKNSFVVEVTFKELKVTSAKKAIFSFNVALKTNDFYTRGKNCFVLKIFRLLCFHESQNFKICDIIVNITAY